MNKCSRCGKEMHWKQTVTIYEECGRFSIDRMVDLCFDCFEKLKVWLNYKSM